MKVRTAALRGISLDRMSPLESRSGTPASRSGMTWMSGSFPKWPRQPIVAALFVFTIVSRAGKIVDLHGVLSAKSFLS